MKLDNAPLRIHRLSNEISSIISGRHENNTIMLGYFLKVKGKSLLLKKPCTLNTGLSRFDMHLS